MLYNDGVTHEFDLKLWVCLQQDFNVTELTREILKPSIDATSMIGENFSTHQSLEQTRDISSCSVAQLLMFLQCLDDVWNEDRGKWNDVRDLLSAMCVMGSRVIVTTWNTPVASVMNTTPAHYSQNLSEKESVSLFFKYAFGDQQLAEQFPKLKHIGEQIVQKCRGVLLALKTLVSLLCSKTDEREWMYVRDNEIWELKQRP